ncbi:exodeoxyribonuclease VII small subunit [Dehalococcoidia bacterium]|nr:exodeoxyribonuclease VII small subunit [Dehalococcoidia bacterium]
MSANTDSDLPFEQAFQKLEETVQALENGGITLDQAVSLYEEGMRLAQLCSGRLDGAELKITELQHAFQHNTPTGEQPDDK